MVTLEALNPQVLVANEPIVSLGGAETEFLKERLRTGGLERVRICCHKSTSDSLHEMLMAFTDATYIRPSVHHDKDESLLFLEGFGTYFFLDEAGTITHQVPLGPLGSGREFYCRIPAHTYHALLVESPRILVKETASGPFAPQATEFASWAPDGTDAVAVAVYLDSLRQARRHR